MNSSKMDMSDSLDISAADFEVGAHAARRSLEKTNERKRRSFNYIHTYIFFN
jgi:hypothetical protein